MKIQSINSFYNISSFRKISSETNNNSFFYKNNMSGDIVSFTAKKYDADTIVNPTNHCAYCGEKVYNEQQLESIAKEMLSSKAERLHGKIKSVLEKMEGAKHSQEIALAKSMENEEQIKFFRNLMDIASKKSFMRGDAIFAQVYNMNRDEALDVLIKNLNPLLKTIDHVSPQNMEQENNNSDMNLVEACYCCNHDLKGGASFNEFYTMFPSIKNNMPPEKFEYASQQLLDSSQSNVQQRLSAANMLKLIERLFVQRTDAANYLDSIDFRIKNCNSGISDSIQSCQDEIAEKETEITALEAKLAALQKDPEYNAMLKRASCKNELSQIEANIASLRERRTKVSNSMNEIKNTKHSQNKKKEQLSPEEKEQKLKALRNAFDSYSTQLSQQEEKALELEIKISDLDEEFPPIDALQVRKNNADMVYNTHIDLIKEKSSLSDKQAKRLELEAEEQSLLAQINSMPASSSSFRVEKYTEEEQAKFKKYQELVEALTFLDEHPNGGPVKAIINKAARVQIVAEIETFLGTKPVIDYNANVQRKDLESQLAKNQKEKQELDRQIDKLQSQISIYERTTSQMTKDEAAQVQKETSEAIRRVTEKENYIKLPQRIATLKAEVLLLKSTIQDLSAKQLEIEARYPANT